MFPVGGASVMLLCVAIAAVVCGLFALAVSSRFGWRWSVCAGLLLWSLLCIGVVTLIPANGAPGIVPAEGRLTECSRDIGGPAPEGFWVLSGGQRMLNTAVFVPAGVLMVLVAARWGRAAWALIPLGLVLLAAYSLAIEAMQLVAARIDRACDLTDVIDNVTGAVAGVAIGLLLLPFLRPWRWVETGSGQA